MSRHKHYISPNVNHLMKYMAVQWSYGGLNKFCPACVVCEPPWNVFLPGICIFLRSRRLRFHV